MNYEELNNDIMFSQIREDTDLDIRIFNRYCKLVDSANVLTIVSGGCTLLSMLPIDNIQKIVGIDTNSEQIRLVEMKLLLCSMLEDPLPFIEGTLSSEEISDMYIKIFRNFLTEEGKLYWDQHIKELYYGINKCGKVEELFRQLSSSGFDYGKIFNSVAIFGNKSSSYLSRPEHFKKVFRNLKNNSSTSDNYHYHSLLYNEYDRSNVPIYLNGCLYKHGNVLKEKLDLEEIDLLSYLKSASERQINADGTFHYINTSVLTDKYTEDNHDELDELLDYIYLCLKPGGVLVMRRLKSGYNLVNRVKDHSGFHIQIETYIAQDSTYFYSELVVATANKEYKHFNNLKLRIKQLQRTSKYVPKTLTKLLKKSNKIDK